MPTPDRFPRNHRLQVQGNRQARLRGLYHGVFAETISDSPIRVERWKSSIYNPSELAYIQQCVLLGRPQGPQ